MLRLRPAVLLITLPAALAAWSFPIGSTFLRLGVGARPTAMAGAFTAVADDANTLYWNPAGLALNRSFSANLSTMRMIQTVSYTTAGVSCPLPRRLGVGFGAAYLGTADTRRDEHGQEIGTFGLSDFVVGPGIAWCPLANLGVGVTARYVASRIDSFQAYSLTADAGLLYRPTRYLSAGLSLLHVGPPRKYVSDWEYQPANLRTGAAVRLPFQANHVIVSSDLSFYPDVAPTISVGIEGFLRLPPASKTAATGQGLALRAGYQSGSHLGTWSGFSLGIGYEYELGPDLSLGVDVVYLSYGLLGGSERASLGLKFSPPRAQR